jgi:hypothetical protein
MERRALILALSLTLPLALYGIPYAYAATTSSSYIVFTSHDLVATSVPPTDLGVSCHTGDYATGGGAGTDGDTTAIVPTFSGPTRAGSVVSSGQPDGWRGGFNYPNPATSFYAGITLEVFAICQTPLTVAGVGVPQFGSLYVAIALGALIYFMLARRSTRKPAMSSVGVDGHQLA